MIQRKNGDTIVRTLPATIRKASDGKSFTFTVSTEAVDRYGEIIRIDGIDTAAYEKNPVILFNHSHREPIGVATNIEKRGGDAPALVAQGVFDEDDPVAMLVQNKIEKKHLRAVSIGLMVKKWKFEDEKGEDLAHPEIELSEMIEFSVVSVPANPEALVIAAGADGDVERRLARIEAMLDRLEERAVQFSEPDVRGQAHVDPEALRVLVKRLADDQEIDRTDRTLDTDATAPTSESADDGSNPEAAAADDVPVEEASFEAQERALYERLASDPEFYEGFIADVRAKIEETKRSLGQA